MSSTLYIFVLVFVGINLAVCDYAKYVEFVKKQALNQTFVKEFEKHVKLFQDHSPKTKSRLAFPCDDMEKPTRKVITAHNLSPFDIKVMAAMGDSVTAGTGIKANTVIGLLIENRGLSWSVGGDGTIAEHETLSNIIKKYNPEVTGYSTGEGPVWFPNARLNVAEPGDKSEAMPGQADSLISKMKADTSFDYENDWKLITMFIGGNDLCDYCDDRNTFSPENYVRNVQTALDKLHAEVPKVFVNLVEVLNIANVNELNQNFICNTLHLFLCRCGAYPWDDEERQIMLEAVDKYQQGLINLVESGRYDTRDDFTVVIQPFFEKTPIPKNPANGETDLSFFSPDCFHLSQKGHEAAADALWNNMIEPVGKKRTIWTPDEPVECPDPDYPYFATYKNSEQIKQLQQRNKQSQDASKVGGSSSTVGAVVGVCVLGLIAVVSLVALRRRKIQKQEQEKLIKHNISLSYTQI